MRLCLITLGIASFAAAMFFWSLAHVQGQGGEEKEPEDPNWLLGPGTSQFAELGFPRGLRRTFVAHGSTPSGRVGIYIYDPNGNCIAWDDVGSGKASAVVAADVMHGTNSRLQIEVHNLGLTLQKITLVQPKAEAP